VRLLRFAFLVIAACGGGQIQNLPLTWRATGDAPRPSAAVAHAFSSVPIAFGLRDVRPDPSAVGTYEDNGFVVRTTDNVAQYCSTRMGEMLARAGARLVEPPTAVVETELLDYHVVEGGTFAGRVRIRTIVRHGTAEVWSRTYIGKSRRWGRTHNPENFNEALSNALADVTAQLVRDDDFGRALVERVELAPPAPPPLDAPSTSSAGASGS
jgi:hypothetical protein